MTSDDVARLWHRGQRGWPAAYPVAQLPNAPLLLALGGLIVGGGGGGWGVGAARGVFHAALAAWAWSEITEGVNGFRRVLGVAGFVYVVVRVAELVGA
jgi:hypothetical protein